MNKRLICAILAAATSYALATSTADASPSTAVEQLISSNQPLIALDAKLNTDYQQALRTARDPARLRAAQRNWIADVRNKCTDTACLLSQYTLRDQQLLAGSPACPATESDLLADWQRVKNGDFEQFALVRDGASHSFSSWLHQRPELTGSWTLKNCTLTISNPSNPALSFEYQIIGYANSLLQLQEPGSGAKSSYKKIPPH